MRQLISRIARLHFNGDTRRGPRAGFIFRQLQRTGCSPRYDLHGNIWVERGRGKPLALFSSHMDVDPRISARQTAVCTVRRNLARGVLDNAVGCAMNMSLARRTPKKGSAIHVFTASEEISGKSPRIFSRSAKEIVRQLKGQHRKPSMCVTIDVTYPRLLMPHHKLDWSCSHEELFYMMDTTHCYLDGYFTRASRRLGARLVKKFNDKKVQVRNLPGHDEAAVYRRLCPAFAFGPVVFGSFDRPGQTMPLSHARTALRFLRSIFP